MRTSWLLLAAVALSGCGEGITYRPVTQLLPSHINKIAIRNVVNKTQQFGLEDKFTLRVRDEFLRDGQYAILPEDSADGLVLVTIKRYILTPVQYDENLVPTAYKLRIVTDLDFIDRTTNTTLWTEPTMEGILTYPAASLAGGMTEEQAREDIWDILARDVVRRVVEGFGSVSGSSKRYIQDGPSTSPMVRPEKDLKPVNPNLY